jgi:hypothetical protein
VNRRQGHFAACVVDSSLSASKRQQWPVQLGWYTVQSCP